MLLQKKSFATALHIFAPLTFAVLFGLALMLRVSLYHIQTSDYTTFLVNWYDFIQTHGGFAALKYNFSNYNVPYLYLLTLLTYIPIAKLITIKTLSVLFDGVLGLFTYLILDMRYRHSYAAITGALVVLFAPTIFINSAAWGQCDAIYTAFCLGSLYFLLKERPLWACIFFGLALSFKLQAIFFLPVLLVLMLKRKLPVQYLLIIPLAFLLLLVPAFIAGRSVPSLLSIYVGQATNSSAGSPISAGGTVPGQGNGSLNRNSSGQFNRGNGGPFNGSGQFNRGGNGQFPGNNGGFGSTGRFYRGGAGSSSSLTQNAPSIYQWFPANAAHVWEWLGIGLAALFVLLIAALVMMSKRPVNSAIILKMTLVFALAIPFLLPEMHERYFYIADVVSILYAFTFPRYFFIAIIVQLCSLLSYAPYFQHTQVVSLAYVAVAVLIVTLFTTGDLVMTLYRGTVSVPNVLT